MQMLIYSEEGVVCKCLKYVRFFFLNSFGNQNIWKNEWYFSCVKTIKQNENENVSLLLKMSHWFSKVGDIVSLKQILYHHW